MSECEYCKSRKMLPLNGKYYCEECEIYYVYKDGRQQYSNLPIEEISQISVGDHLCKKCRLKYSEKKSIVCTTFREYFKKLPLCRKCKQNNQKCIKNTFFQNFILYRTYSRVFSVQSVVFHSIWLYLMGTMFLSKLIITNLIIYKRKGLKLLECLMSSILLIPLGYWSWGTTVFYLYCFLTMVFSKRWYYKVPVNLDGPPPNILKYLEHLNIGRKKDG
ncbi:uncharacterized protein Eint_070050 [Encephalitozoon intestinalis ATCC 50506]|uniref:Uncharacterized protein n=1 Tax=Encephalitozoon intestinalis (strain ATCC 50506) TaxID=876142 RepID=E0S7T5_ENCIT|nr:uncharacterized protein Eint_070050 [Encephalitozoon intestinalis ATCC 50506]ADM11770.1 hypothetical protein Eint_070050 [Encephalitozoon intestinalis ATCC 50506]UTX45518.1 hypothetical protein GPK93_07g10800 [Encephalitozoon intestinalis]